MFQIGPIQCLAQQNVEQAAQYHLGDIAGDAGGRGDKVAGDDALIEIVAAGAEKQGGDESQIVALAQEGGGLCR